MFVKKTDTLIAIAYTGDHHKMREGFIDPIKHQQMLIEAIRNINPDDEFNVLVSCNKHSIMDISSDEERSHAWQIYKMAAVLSLRENNGHQMGQAWAILQALEYANTHGFTRLFWSGDDILYDDPFAVKKAISLMDQNKSSYIGRNWNTPTTLDCQIFGCQVQTLLRLFKPLDFAARGGCIEPYMYDILLHEPKTMCEIAHYHEHDPAKFISLLPIIKEKFARQRGAPGPRGPSRIGLPSYRV